MHLKDALTEARRLGCEVRKLKASGEVAIIFPDGKRLNANVRKKDASRKVLMLLRRLREARRPSVL